MKLTTDILMKGTGCSSAVAAAWLSAMQAATDKFGISDGPRLAAFLANVGVESNGLTALVENLNYSAPGLANTWPARYAVDPHVLHKIPNETAYRIQRQPELIANTTYANRMGNGDVNSGDGWKYRGQGPIQVTGKNNITAFFHAIGAGDGDPASLQQPEMGAMSAAWFFSTNAAHVDESAPDFFACTVKSVNGQMPCAANQGDRRCSLYDSVLPLATAPTKAVQAPVKAAKTAPQQTAQDTP